MLFRHGYSVEDIRRAHELARRLGMDRSHIILLPIVTTYESLDEAEKMMRRHGYGKEKAPPVSE